MMLPTLSEIRKTLADFVHTEQLSWGLILHPSQIIQILLRHRFIHFLFVGGGGLAISLGVTWFFTQFLLGLEKYFTAYLIGTAAALVFNFTMYSLVIFRTSREHARRLFVYFAYILCVILIQAQIVSFITPIVGLSWYLVVIATVIAFFSVVNFLVFKLSIFKERDSLAS